MGTVFKKQTTRPVPPGAEILNKRGQRFARWKGKQGQRTAPLTTGTNGEPRLLIESRTYFAKFRDGSGIVRTVATGCRTEQSARQVLADLEKTSERVKARVMSAAEANCSERLKDALDGHIRDYLDNLELQQTTAAHRSERGRQLLGWPVIAVGKCWAT